MDDWQMHLDAWPPSMRDAVRQYIFLGRPTGSFLTAVFENDFCEAACHADSANQFQLKVYGEFLRFYAPPDCWGSREKVRAWRDAGGLLGKRRKREKQEETDGKE